jgi:hypothetical protein
MSHGQSFAQRLHDYRPSKATWFWSTVASVVVVLILGFTNGGWTTSSYATTVAQQAAHNARAELAAAACVDKFLSTENAADNLGKLKDASHWEQDDLIKEGGWARLAGMDESVPGAVDKCADALLAMDRLPVRVIEIAPARSDG